MFFHSTISLRMVLVIVALILAVQGIVIASFGQPVVCPCGVIKIWESSVTGVGNNQQMFDWYTFSHIIHGFLFYLLLWALFPKMPIVYRLFIAMGIEVGWEMLENTPWTIAHYREQPLAANYAGDSVLNSLLDTFSMICGFFLARRLPVWSVILLILIMELGVAFVIRDNLTLNVLNFFHQFNFISAWQSGASVL